VKARVTSRVSRHPARSRKRAIRSKGEHGGTEQNHDLRGAIARMDTGMATVGSAIHAFVQNAMLAGTSCGAAFVVRAARGAVRARWGG